MRKDAPLAHKEAICINDLLDLPLIVSRQGIREDIPKIFGEMVDRLNIVATINLTYNGSILVRKGLGYILTFDHLVDTSEQSELCFRPLAPTLETKLYVIWKKYQVFSPAAELLLDSVYRKYMESVVAMLFANILTYHIADLWKFTYYYPLFEIAHFGKMRKSLEFLYF